LSLINIHDSRKLVFPEPMSDANKATEHFETEAFPQPTKYVHSTRGEVQSALALSGAFAANGWNA